MDEETVIRWLDLAYELSERHDYGTHAEVSTVLATLIEEMESSLR